jgi:hypothetical protein
MPRITITNALWLTGYVVLAVVLVIYLMQLRGQTLEEFGTPAAQQEWDSWKSEAKRQMGDDTPVKRGHEPLEEQPMLLLMRDHFPVVLGGGLFFGTAIYAVMMFAVRGVLAGTGRKASDS